MQLLATRFRALWTSFGRFISESEVRYCTSEDVQKECAVISIKNSLLALFHALRHLYLWQSSPYHDPRSWHIAIDYVFQHLQHL